MSGVSGIDWDGLWKFIGQTFVIVVVPGTWLAKTYIDKWLTKRFQGQLDALKHAQVREIEHLKAKVAALLDRATKLHQHEFEVLPSAWDKLSITMGSAARLVSPLQTYAAVGKMSLEELDVTLSKTSFAEHEKAAIKKLERRARDNAYQELANRDRMEVAFQDRQVFHNYIIQHGIFIEPEIRAKMMAVSALLHDALITHSHITEPDYPLPRGLEENSAKVLVEGKELVTEIETLVSDRLWNAVKLDDGRV